MKVILANDSGFCDGVKRAIRLALNGVADHGRLVADGPLVHNRQAVDFLSLHGVETGIPESGRNRSILIRAHGARPSQRRRWRDQGATLVDATCMHVARNQELARRAGEAGLRVVLAGDRDHAEVAAVSGAASAGCDAIATLAEAESYAAPGPFMFMAQTTFDVAVFTAMAKVLSRRYPDCRIQDTICRATHTRQAEARRLARRADALVVVGGAHSANTRRLADAGKAEGRPVFAVETAADLDPAAFAPFASVAVIAGASTPGWITQEVADRLRFLGRATPAALAERFLYLLVETRILTALAAVGLALAAGLAVLSELRADPALAAGLYVFFAHTLNRRVPANPAARRLSPADSFYRVRRLPMLLLAWLALALSLALAAGLGRGVLFFYLGAALAAALLAWVSRRATPATPARPHPGAADGTGRARRESALSLARLLVVATGWALVLVAPVAAEAGPGTAWITAGAFVFVLLVRLGGALVRDLHDIASDRLMGIDTLPGHIGPARAARLGELLLGLAAALPFLAAAGYAWSGRMSAEFVFLVCLPVAPALGIRLMELVKANRLADAVRLRAGLDGMGCLAGLLAVACGAGA